MTGSGTATGPTTLGELTVECRSVNGRNLAIKSRLPQECQGLEAACDAVLRSRLDRGSVSLGMIVADTAGTAEPVVDVERAAAVAAELEALATRLGKSVALSDVLAFPGVVPANNRAAPRPSRDLPADIAGLLRSALDALVASRQEEGAATKDAILAEIGAVEGALAAIEARAPEVVAAYREKLIARVNEFLEGRATAMEEKDVIREVSVFADRVDITEELQRLAAHMQKARGMLEAGGVVGRSLEFLVQEMLREVNTLGSKSPDVTIAHIVVDMKSSIDKLKEQAANLE